MKRIIKAVLSAVISIMLCTHSFIVSAIDFDAEETFNSVFVVISGNALGSGFALGENCVVTNAHVIQDTSNVKITAYDGQEYSAVIYCKSDELDIAVLSVSSGNFIPITIGKDSDIKIGDDVYAIGAPNGMSYTLTKGTLSSNKREISGDNYLQIDAALNEGNSGGPLLDCQGAVIGMNTMKMNNSEGLGLAIPIDRIIRYMKSNDISITDNGIADIPEIENHAEMNTNFSASESIDVSEKLQQEQTKQNNEPVLIAIICVSVICNIIMLLIMLFYRSKWRALKTEQSERTDFEIDFWE